MPETGLQRQALLKAVIFFMALGAALYLYPLAVVAVLAISAIIFVHEFGHFIVCKISGIRVETFSIGFWEPLISFEHGGTRYQIGSLPFGGFVKPAGEFTESEDPKQHAPDEFLGKPWYIRAAVLLAGPLFNFIFPVVFLFLLYAGFGVPSYIAPPLVIQVIDNSAAQEAGLKAGDQILRVDGEWTFDIRALQVQIDEAARKHPSVETKLSVLRDNKEMEMSVLSRLDHGSGRYRLGVSVEPGPEPLRRRVDSLEAGTPAENSGLRVDDEILSVGGKLLRQGTDFSAQFADAATDVQGNVAIEVTRYGKTVLIPVKKKQPVSDGMDPKIIGLLGLGLESNAGLEAAANKEFEKVSLGEAASFSLAENVFLVEEIAENLRDLVLGKIAIKESLGGPVAIVRMASQEAKNGIFKLLTWIMGISVLLGVTNLLPIPLLDGGTMLLCIVEGLRRRPLSYRLQNSLQNVSGAILALFMLYVTYNDVVNWIRASANH